MSYKEIENNLDKYRALNTRIKNIQDKVIDEVKRLDKELRQRVADKSDFLDDYEIEIRADFYLKEDDKEYDEAKDNILARIIEYEKDISSDEKKDKNLFEHRWGKTNHNEFRARAGHPMRNEYHCWWFHCLYDHTDLQMEDLLRIGGICTDVRVCYQFIDQE